MGNRIKLETTGDLKYSIEYEYDNNNRLSFETYKKDTIVRQKIYYYDNNGNEIRTIRSMGGGIDFYEDKAYDEFNQLVRVANTNYYLRYTYKPDGTRLSKGMGNEVTNFVTVDGNVFAELDQSGKVRESYIRDMNSIIRGSNVYYLYNGHGDVTQLTNFSGIVTKNYDYDSFGVDGKNNWYDGFYNNDTNPWRYCGEYFDYETKTVYLRARNYTPNTGRFNSEDPARAGLNWYTYCNGNPVNRIDWTIVNKVDTKK